jgi:glutaconate CoA-transferase subunit A
VSEQLTPQQVADAVPDGATVALGGVRLQRRPLALAQALARAGRRDLTIVTFLGSLDVEVLLAAGCVAELHAAAVSLDAVGLAPHYREARQTGDVRFVEWSEGLLLTSLEAAARGVPASTAWMGLGSDLPAINPWLQEGSDPFQGKPVMNVRALEIDVALLHVSHADDAGNLYIDGDAGVDGLFARAARRTLVSCERRQPDDPRLAAVSRLWVDGLIDAPGGAWPGGCRPHYAPDLEAVRRGAHLPEDIEALAR